MSSAHENIPHYTVADYQQWEGDWELWQGHPVSMTPSPFGRHSKLLANLVTALNNAIRENRCHATVLVEIDWIVSSDTVLRPDLSLVCGTEPEGHVESAPALVAEVLSDSTRTRDLEFKRTCYEEHGVGCYLIVDPQIDRITVLERQSDGKFRERPPKETIAITLCDTCSISFRSADVFE